MTKPLALLARTFPGLAHPFKRWLVNASPLAPYMYALANMNEFSSRFIHEKMLADSQRVEPYHNAITKLIRPGDVVVDVGCGTGVLSLFAARSGAKVYGFDHTDIVEIARMAAEENGFTNIEFAKCHSRDFVIDEKADVLIHDQIGGGGAGAFSENMIETLLDLRRRVLKPGGRILPNKFDIYIEPVQLKSHYRVPFLWEQNVHGIKFGFLRDSTAWNSRKSVPITDYECVEIHPEWVDGLLCEPSPILTIDLETISEKDIPRSISYDSIASRNGRVDGLCVYFRAYFDSDIYVESSPLRKKTSWLLSMFRIEALEVEKGQRIRYSLDIESIRDHKSWTLRWGS